MAESEDIGRDAFLDKYGFGPARQYFLDYEGRLYDSKAIVGVAYGYQFPGQGPLQSDHFSGGKDTVQPKLEELGFDVRVLEYGQISPSLNTTRLIYRFFDRISDQDARRFVKGFRQSADPDQHMHILRELALGAYLSASGFTVRYEPELDGVTPDWCVFDENSQLTAVVEACSFHLDLATRNHLEAHLEPGAVVAFWRDATLMEDAGRSNVDRLYDALKGKVVKYKDLVRQLRVPYVVALFPEFQACIDVEELQECLSHKEWGLFQDFPHTSGVLLFEQIGQGFYFHYIPNPHATTDLHLPSTAFWDST